MVLSAVLAAVSSAPRGIQTDPTDTARCSFQPYHQPCHPDFDHPASVSIDVCGISPASLCFLCQTPPLVFKGVLSTATARPWAAQGVSTRTRCRPKQP